MVYFAWQSWLELPDDLFLFMTYSRLASAANCIPLQSADGIIITISSLNSLRSKKIKRTKHTGKVTQTDSWKRQNKSHR